MKAREIAFKVLCDIEDNNNYSNIAINKHFKNLDIANQDRGLATELIYGVIENQYYLDYIINKLSKIKTQKLSTYVKILLRMGIYQIAFLDSISEYAAVNETVNLVKKYDKRSSGFVNAILRNVIRNKDEVLDINTGNEIMDIATKYSYSPWIIKDWTKNFGKEFTQDLLEANSEKPNLYLRVNTIKISRDELINRLQEQGIKASKVNTIEEAIKVENLKNIENNELFKQGLFTIQDISSMVVGKVMNPKENSMVLDVCSAPGGKTTHMATLMNNTGKVVARDVFEHKLKLINDTVNRLGLANVDVENFDASQIDTESLDKFDYVLTDVPCSGLGIIRRKPEIKYKEKADLKDLPKIQYTILENASKYVKIGGTLIYSTCTIQDKENIEVIEKFINEYDNFELVPINEINIDLDNQDKGYLKIYPNIHGMDGFFISKLRRVR
ncbi:16S rRNA (cytosine(967)-C(5))-methyltransferase RsmB [Romboutsia lituseburensis]|uniref:16S rRNA (cytosine(967)-C(5))-methyltransferase n=1 Tax=Romboutsia lituseburensis DSM 797 TaxID=1121325 RepID=A0A1G9QDV6_9FIRM|nr:16S rRNA (cytosine(967)-C(5))-methyltransferase RsmB [Romboutsia lituseburensis]CEH35441.1 Ribosomal RNA small subunit methyltransferase B [Romboutsia lituseburensis]SDM08515.1 16S rRNA (cytosine967-C5)-methyltransferase [Romboutsia lituseburensis DSM 797]